MARKLKTDQISLEIYLTTSEAQKSIQQLTGSIRNSEATIRAHRKVLSELEAQGKRDSDEYRRLEQAIQDERDAIRLNTADLRKQVDALNLDQLTMSQLRKRAAELKRELDNLVKANDPQKWEEVNRKYQDALQYMSSLKSEVTQTGMSIVDIFKNKFSMFTAAGNLISTAVEGVVSTISEAVSALQEFTLAGIEMAASTQGIQQAFDRIATDGTLKTLRTATNGMVNDMALMQAAVQAENFNIPLQHLGKLLAFAQQRAKDTGESVDYLVESIVKGLGRKSPLILDNLGLSVSKLNAEVKKTGDFAEAVVKVVEEEMSEVGRSITTAADIATQKAVAMENMQLRWGQRFVTLSETWDKFVTGFVNGITKMVEPQKSQVEQYEEQIKKVADLEVNTAALARRYDELKAKTKLTKEEQAELNRVMNVLAQTVPEVITQYNELEEIISIDTQKVYDFIEAQRALLQVMNSKAIEEQRKNLEKYTQTLSELQKQMDILNTGGTPQKWIATPSVFGQGGDVKLVDLTPEEIDDVRKNHAKYKSLVLGTETWIKQMDGTAIADQVNAQKKRIEKRNEFNAMTKQQLDEYVRIHKDAADKYVEIAQEVYNYRFGAGDDEGDDKGAVNKRVQAVENQLTAEVNLLKKKRTEGLLTEKEYNRQVEALTIENLRKRMAVKGQESADILSLESQIYDAELKLQQEADAELLEAMKRTHDQQLRLLEEKRNKQLEDLQVEESDQKLYALRAAEIEAEYSAERLGIIQKFGEEVAAAEFKNAELRQKAVDDSNKEMTDAETALTKSKDKIQRLYLKTSADFERQFRIKSWTQRKEDELALLQRYFDKQLIDEETRRIAVAAVEKKYADEKFRVRQEYELNNLKMLYDKEMEALTQQQERELLSVEEQEAAKLQIKLKYAGELVRQQQDYAQHAFDTVKAFEESETASVQTEYAKREAALTDQYNQGILSQEAYNQQKEQLDYEQRVKELEVQKKYADVNFAMQASQIIATGAVAAIQAFSSMAAIPIVGPILGDIAAAAVAVTTALQLTKAKAERDRVKAMTIESPGGGGGTPAKTGSIQLKPGLAEGGYNAPGGYAEGGSNAADDRGDLRPGGYTGSGAKYDVAGWLPVHSGEYVVDTESLKYPDVVDKVRAIERVRRRHTSRNPLPEGFAEGGSNTGGERTFPDGVMSEQTARQLQTLLTRLIEGDITVNYGITELEARQREKQKNESNFTLKN